MYAHIDYSRLGAPVAEAAARKTGYSSAQKWGALLAAIAARNPVWLATNSGGVSSTAAARAGPPVKTNA